MTIECVEIDPEVTRIAREYFGFPGDEEIRVHTADGRSLFLRIFGRRLTTLSSWTPTMPTQFPFT